MPKINFKLIMVHQGFLKPIENWCVEQKNRSLVFFLLFNSWHDMLAGKNERVSYGYHHMYLLHSTVTISAEGVLSHSYDS